MYLYQSILNFRLLGKADKYSTFTLSKHSFRCLDIRIRLRYGLYKLKPLKAHGVQNEPIAVVTEGRDSKYVFI